MADIDLLLKVNTSSGEVRLGEIAKGLDSVGAKAKGAQDDLHGVSGSLKVLGVDFGSAASAALGLGAGFGIAQKAVDLFLGAIVAVPAAVLEMTSAWIKHGGELTDVAARTGLAIESYQKLTYAAKLGGVSQEELVSSIEKMKRSIVEAPQKFEKLGLSVSQLIAMRPEDAFQRILEKVSAIENPTLRSAEAMQIFGKTGSVMLQLGGDIQETSDRAEHLGFVMSTDTARAADALGDELDTLGLTWNGLKDNLVSLVAQNPDVLEALRGITEGIGAITRAIKENAPQLSEMLSLLLRLGPAAQAIDALKITGALLERSPTPKTPTKFAVEPPTLDDEFARIQARGIAMSGELDAVGRRYVETVKRTSDQVSEILNRSTKEFFDQQAALLDKVRGTVSRPLDEALSGSTGLFGATGGNFGSLGIQTVTDAEMKAAVEAINRGWSEGERRTNEAKQKLYDAGKAWHVSWAEGMSALASGFEALGGRIGSILGGIMRDLLGIGQAMKSLNFKGGITGGAGLGGLLSNIGGVLSIAGAGFSILKGIGSLFGIGKHKEPPPPPPTWEEKWKQAIEDVDKFALVGSRDIRALLDASGPAGHRKAEAQQYVNEQLGKSTSAMGAIGGLAINSQASAQAQATIFTTTFWATVKEQGLVKGVDALAAPFAALKEKLAAGGFDVNALLGSVGGLFDAVEGPARSALEAMDALNQSLQGVANAGYLTRDSFAAYGVAAGDAFQQARDAGLDQNQALQAIAPLLGSIISASDQYGFAIDANTQALIDQAKAAGIAFPEDPMERAAKAMEKLVEHLERIYGLSEDIGTSFNNMQVPAVPGSGGGPHAQGYSPEGYAGGFSTYSMPPGPLPGGGTPVVLHPREQVSVVPAGRRSPGGFTGGIGSIQVAAGAISVQGGDPQRTAVAVLEKIADGAADEIILRRIGWRVRGKL